MPKRWLMNINFKLPVQEYSDSRQIQELSEIADIVEDGHGLSHYFIDRNQAEPGLFTGSLRADRATN